MKNLIEALKQVAEDWGFKPTENIVMATKKSEPYLQTEFGDVIDLDKYKKDVDGIYRNEKLLTSVKQSMLEAQQGKGVLCATREDIYSYLASL